MSASLTLSNAAISLDVAPSFGARITKLIDRRTGRNWLVGGALAGDQSDAADYSVEQARGWDECLPTVTPCASSLRNHGDFWGRAAECVITENSLTSSQEENGLRLERTVELSGETLIVRYKLTNTSGAPKEWMWSQHCLLDLAVGDRLFVDGCGRFRVSGATKQNGGVPQSFEWPTYDTARPNLTAVEGKEANWAMKSYAPVNNIARAGAIGADGSNLAFEWSAEDVPYLGLWLAYGGWPTVGAKNHQVAIEPTTAPVDHLDAAKDAGSASLVRPNEPHSWTIRLHLTQSQNTETTP